MTERPEMPEPALAVDDLDHEYDDAMPQRPRARYLTPLTALLMALILGGVGFYVGIRVEKAQGGSTSGASAFRGGFPGVTGATGSTGKSGSTSRTGFAGSSSLASRFASAFGGGAGGGTV